MTTVCQFTFLYVTVAACREQSDFSPMPTFLIQMTPKNIEQVLLKVFFS
jgi:hypothetical protein